MKYLFIGGCADGEWNEVDIKKQGVVVIVVPTKTPLGLASLSRSGPYTTEEYHLEELAEMNEVYTVFVKSGLKPFIPLLIKGYRRDNNSAKDFSNVHERLDR